MSPYNFIYGRPYITHLSWNHLKYQAILGLKILQEMEEKMAKTIIVYRTMRIQKGTDFLVAYLMVSPTHIEEEMVSYNIKMQFFLDNQIQEIKL